MDGDNDIDEDNDVEFEALDLSGEELFIRDLQRVMNNDDHSIALDGGGDYHFIQNIANDEWEEIGRDISNNTHLVDLCLTDGALNGEKITHLFRGLTRSTAVGRLLLQDNEISAAGVRSMVPFLQNANNLRWLDLSGNNIQSEGFNILLQALRDSPIQRLECIDCGIESIEIDTEHFPRRLTQLGLMDNNINADGCREIAKLLQGGDSILTHLFLIQNKIDDEGVAILVNALRSNTSLTDLMLTNNNGISKKGQIMVLKLVNDISSIQATLQSNHTLKFLAVSDELDESQLDESQLHINTATGINREFGNNPEAAGREKVIQTQLRSTTRAELAELQGVSHSVYSEIDPLHLPEVLSLVGKHHGQGELFAALKSSIAGVISTVNRKQCLKQQLAYYAAKSAELHAEIAKIEAAERSAMVIERGEYCSNKRKRRRT